MRISLHHRGSASAAAAPAFAFAVLLGACSVTGPVAVITPRGDVLRGTTTSTLSGGDFTVSNGSLQCHGNFDPAPGSRTVSVAASCSDGRVGIGRAVRDSPLSGIGKIQMNDGTEATFVFGAAASGI
jgi:hypothetical protein